jgi:hypothetical protein
MIRVCFLASLFLVSLTATWAQPADLTGKIRVSYRDGDPAPNYGVEYHYYKTNSQLVFLDSTERSLNNYTWDSGTGRLTDSSFGEYFDYTDTGTDSGTFVFSEGGTGTFVIYDASWDLDYDGTPDGEQIDAGNLPNYSHVLDLSSDADLDSLNLAQEGAAGTDPGDSDTDGDTRTDGNEVLAGTSPLKKNFGPYELEWHKDLSEVSPVTYSISASADPGINPYSQDIYVRLTDGSYPNQFSRIVILSSSGEVLHASGLLDKLYDIVGVASAQAYIIRDSFATRADYIYEVIDLDTYSLIPLHEINTKTQLKWGGMYERHDSKDYIATYGWEVYKYAKQNDVDVFTGEASYGITGENFMIRWSSESGVQYQIQKSTDLASWEDIGMPITGNGIEMQWAEPFEGDSVFYRLVLP